MAFYKFCDIFCDIFFIFGAKRVRLYKSVYMLLIAFIMSLSVVCAYVFIIWSKLSPSSVAITEKFVPIDTSSEAYE